MMENKNRTYLEAADIYEPTDLVHNNKDGSKYKEKDNEPLDTIKGNPDDVITMSHVDIGFKRGTDLRVVVEDFSLAIKRGEIFGLVGESGSGKTTVGRSIMRIIPILKGKIRYNGHLISGNVSKARAREIKTKIQMIFQ
ncbi:MAG: ATP-binding cassette domain-containing protein, partial [Bacilli bacterium]|nr:ATP-binding cassette domain-containing protein [Bacilli bacterium]